MLRVWLRLIGFLTAVWALPILILRAQPYKAGDLRAFLTPPAGCPAPCFLGVQPGITRLDEAQIILEAHPWIARVEPDRVAGIYRAILSPETELAQRGAPAPLLQVDSGVVRWIFWNPHMVTRGELRLALGPPETIRVVHDHVYGSVPLLLLYPQYDLRVISPLYICTLSQARFWNSQDDWNGIYIGDAGDANHNFGVSNTGQLLPSSDIEPVAWLHNLYALNTCKGDR